MAAIPEVLRLHRARLTEPDVETIDGVRVTTPLRTLIDVMVEGNLAIELQAHYGPPSRHACSNGLVATPLISIACDARSHSIAFSRACSMRASLHVAVGC